MKAACACVAVVFAACDPSPSTSIAPVALAVGVEVDVAPTGLVAPPESQFLGALATTATGYVALWTDFREAFGVIPVPPERAYFTRIASDGSVLDPTGIPLGVAGPAFWTRVGAAMACSPAGACLIVAHDQASQAIKGVRIAGNQVLDAAPRVLHDAHAVIDDFALAWDGTGFRVTWRELIADTVSTATIGLDGAFGAPVIVASPANSARLACQQPGCLITYRKGVAVDAVLSGRVVDAAGALGPELVVMQPPGRMFGSTPIWDGQQYWVGLTHNLALESQFGARIVAVRITPDGSVLDPVGIAVAAGASLQATYPPRVGFDGTHTVVVWGALSNNGQPSVKVARLTAVGTVVDPGGVPFVTPSPIMIDTSVGFLVDVACHPPACLATWTQPAYLDERVAGARFTGTTVIDPGGIAVATAPPGGTAPAITYGLGHYVAVWRDGRDSSQDSRVSPIRGAVLDPSMAPIAAIEIAPSAQPDPVCRHQEQPAIATSATNHLVVWHEGCQYNNNIYGELLDASGQPVPPAFVVDNTVGNETHPSVASDGSGYLAVWDNTARPIEIQGRRFTATGAPLGVAFTITDAGHIPVVAFDGASYLVVYRRTSGGQRDLYAARISPAGAILGGEIAIAQTPAGEEGQSVACGGGVCLVVWRSTQVRALRIGSDGSVLDPGGFVVGSVTGSVFATSVTWDGSAFVVTWRTASELRAARVAASGALLTTTHPVIATATPPDRPSVASNGAGHVALLYDRFDSTPAVRVRRVRARAIVDDDAPPVDAGVVDAALDAVVDAAPDAAVDAAPDAAIDAAPDAAVDAAPDAAIDAAVDAARDGAVASDALPVDTAAPPADAAASSGGTGCSAANDPSVLGWLLGLTGLARMARRGKRNQRV